jgi:MFS family permease
LADAIAKELFPDDGGSEQLIKSLAVFGAAFLTRPLGGIAIGWVGDRFGRRKALEISIALMLFPSFLIGCLPPYRTIGISATIMLIILRLIQGLAVGGELVGAFIYTIENTGGVHRGFWGACCKASGNMGSTIGMGVAALLRYFLAPEDFYSWGWRLPFLSGIVFGAVGIWLRAQLGAEEGEGDNDNDRDGDDEKIPQGDTFSASGSNDSDGRGNKEMQAAGGGDGGATDVGGGVIAHRVGHEIVVCNPLTQANSTNSIESPMSPYDDVDVEVAKDQTKSVAAATSSTSRVVRGRGRGSGGQHNYAPVSSSKHHPDDLTPPTVLLMTPTAMEGDEEEQVPQLYDSKAPRSGGRAAATAGSNRGKGKDDGDMDSGGCRDNPVVSALYTQWPEMICVGLVAAFWGCCYYTAFVWSSYFMSSPALIGGTGVPNAWWINFAMNAALVVVFPFCGRLGDYVGSVIRDDDRGFQLTMQAGMTLMLFTAVPAFALISTRSIGGVLLGQSCLIIAVGLYGANLPAFMVSQFQERTRYSGVGIGKDEHIVAIAFTVLFTSLFNDEAMTLSLPSIDNNVNANQICLPSTISHHITSSAINSIPQFTLSLPLPTSV